jgi:hypothetical protein
LQDARLKKTSSSLLPFYVAVVLSTSAGFADLIIGILVGQEKTVPFRILILSLALTTAVIFLVYGVLWFFVVEPLGRRLKLLTTPWAVATAVFIGAFFLFCSIHNLFKFYRSSAGIIELFVAAVIAFLMAAIVYFAARSISETSNYSKTAVAVACSTPLLIAEFALTSLLPIAPVWAISGFTTLHC